jgi:uncharacterized metal-binding protein YceD (DUF177 family)
MIIPIVSIPEAGLDFEHTIPATTLDIPEIQGDHHIHCKFHLSHQDDAILLRGEIHLEATTTCVRCLDAIPLQIHIPDFVLLVEKSSTDVIDLIPLVREEILLVMPQYAKCQLDAQGNCPITGKNWNNLNEFAPHSPLSDPWSELDKLKKTT